jgi:hypothetical protein
MTIVFKDVYQHVIAKMIYTTWYTFSYSQALPNIIKNIQQSLYKQYLLLDKK